MLYSQPYFTFSRLLKFCLSLLIALPVPLVAQDPVTGAFRGTVTDRVTNRPIAGATVEITSALTQASVIIRTDAQGQFYYGLLNPGVYTITISAPGHDAQTLTRTVLATQVNTVIPIPVKLTPTVTPPQPPTVRGVNEKITVTGPAAGAGGKTNPPPPGSAPGDPPALAAEINRTDGRRGGAFTAEAVSTLPLGTTTFTRSFDELALLLPGVALPPETQGSVAGPGVGAGVGSAGQFAVNGLRSRGNNFTVDGSDNNDEDIGVRRQGFFALVPQPIESVQEYQVATLLAPAQYGRNLSAQVNAVSKTGGSAVHGTVYGFLNTRALNSTDFFDTTHREPAVALRSVGGQPVLDCTKPPCEPLSVANNSTGKDPLTFGQAGAVFGAPLVRERLFSFFSYERQVLNARREAHFAVPTVDERGIFGMGATGYFYDPFESFRRKQTVPEFGYPTSLEGDAIFSLFPFPNDPDGVYGAHTFSQELPASARGNIASVRLDGNFDLNGRRQTATARYNFTDDWREIPVTGGALFSTLRPRVRTHNFSSYVNGALGNAWLNQLRFSYGRTRLRFDEARDTTHLRPSRISPNEPFLLNAALRVNNTLPVCLNSDCTRTGPNTGPVLYATATSDVESRIGRVGQVNIAGFSPVGVDVFNFPQRRVNDTYQFADTLSWQVGGGHNPVFGADLRITNLNSFLPRNSRTLLTFNGNPTVIEDRVFTLSPINLAAEGVPSGAFLSLADPQKGQAEIRLRYYQSNFFAQDEWRVRSNFSLSYGLRYEYNTPPAERDNIIERTFTDPILNDPAVSGAQKFIAGRRRIFDPDANNIAPRVGVAYAPAWFGQNRETVIRAGYGLYYDQAIGAVVSQSRNVIPNFLTVNTGGFVETDKFDFFNPSRDGLCFKRDNLVCTDFRPLVQPGTLNTRNSALTINQVLDNFSGSSIFPNAFSFTLPARRFPMPMAHQYAVTVEQQLARGLWASVAYVGTTGRNLLRTATPNLGPNNIVVPLRSSVDENSLVPYFAGVTRAPNFGRPTNGLGAVTLYETTARSRYDALQVQLRGRLTRFDFQFNYTLSKALDDVSDIFDLAGASALPQNSLKPDERGPANFDARHRVAYQITYALPTLSGSPAVGRLFFGGWEILSTGQFQTGQPFTVNSLIDINLDGNLTDRLGSIGRNAFRAGNYLLLNLAVVKNFNLTEQQRVTLRAEFFNFINRANFGVPVRFLEAPGFGQATDTVTPGRRVQFALKYSF